MEEERMRTQLVAFRGNNVAAMPSFRSEHTTRQDDLGFKSSKLEAKILFQHYFLSKKKITLLVKDLKYS